MEGKVLFVHYPCKLAMNQSKSTSELFYVESVLLLCPRRNCTFFNFHSFVWTSNNINHEDILFVSWFLNPLSISIYFTRPSSTYSQTSFYRHSMQRQNSLK